MSRTNHAKREYETRTARDNEAYRQKIATRDANRQLREQVREFDRFGEWVDWALFVPTPLAA